MPVVATINGVRLLIGGNADGSIYAMKIRTGESVWGFKLSRRGINSSVVVAGDKVYAAHSEENLDNTALGRVVCIDATGQGDVTNTHEVWRYDGVFAGYTSPVIHDSRLYITDNSANIHALDAETGQVHWVHNIGTVGKGSPVFADGRLYTPEVNGRFAIVAPGSDTAETLDLAEIAMPDGRPAELFGSPAVAYGPHLPFHRSGRLLPRRSSGTVQSLSNRSQLSSRASCPRRNTGASANHPRRSRSPAQSQRIVSAPEPSTPTVA